MNLEQIYFPVTKLPVSQFIPGFEFQNDITHCVIVEPSPDKHRIVNFCSEGYNLQTNEEIVDPFLTEIRKYFGNVEVKSRMRGFSQFWVDIIISSKPETIAKGDIINPRITIGNSYDGKVKYQFEMGAHRVLCSNGLTLPFSSKKFKAMHTPGLDQKTTYERVLSDLSLFIADLGILTDAYQELRDQPVISIDKRVDSVIEETEFPASYRDEVLMIVNQELIALENQKPNDWIVYNGFNNILNHSETLKVKESRKEELDREVFNYLYNY